MYRNRQTQAGSPRRAVILVVVLALLSLFAVVALAFVLYAMSAADAARVARESESSVGPNVEPEQLLGYFLGQFIYDAPDDATGVYSALRGHSLARSMYGWNGQQGQNTTPFNGIGRRRDVTLGQGGPSTYSFINHTYYATDGFVLDPERLPRASLQAPQGSYVAPANVPYTYPDLNNVFLAAVDSNGQVLAKSFVRNEDVLGPFNAGNPNWQQLWTQAGATKYQVMRPRPAEHGQGFPAPDADGGDVKNLVGAPGGNDSIWLDLGFPVISLPDGRKFKPLFAPLIIDLDNRLNVNVHGTIKGQGNTHQSHQGWGPWEANLGLLPWAQTNPTEWTNLFAHQQYGRYMPGGSPGPSLVSGTNALPGTSPRYYAQVNYDGDKQAQAMNLPGSGGNPGFNVVPTYSAAFGNGNMLERQNHPLLYHPLNPVQGSNRKFALSNMEALLRYGETNSPMLTSDLFNACSGSFNPASNPGAARLMRLLTTTSKDVDRPGVTAMKWQGTPPYQMAQGALSPSGGASTFPPLNATMQPPATEFGTDWRAFSAQALPRLNLNRPLPAYPKPQQGGLPKLNDQDPATVMQFLAAQSARQQLASDIFLRLVLATGANAAAQAGTPEYNAVQWLAQLAANVVDYIDSDDTMTPFYWRNSGGRQDPNQQGAQPLVWGTELPRVVINEVYVEFMNDTTDPNYGQTKPLEKVKQHVWVELVNVLGQDTVDQTAGPERSGDAYLEVPDPNSPYPVYQVVVTNKPNVEQELRQDTNVTGEVQLDPAAMNYGYNILGGNQQGQPAAGTRYYAAPTTPALPTGVNPPDVQDPHVIHPVTGYAAGQTRSNSGFYVIGPVLDPNADKQKRGERNTLKNQQGQSIATLLRPEMSFDPKFKVADADPKLPNQGATTSVLLRRLACPYLPWNASTNPYVTVDYVRDVPGNDVIKWLNGRMDASRASDVGPAPDPLDQQKLATFFAYGKRQPYGSEAGQWVQQAPQPANTDQPQHTFFRHNGTTAMPPQGPDATLTQPFDWLAHLDRQLISPIELFHVSGFRPHLLTQQFITQAAKQQHVAPWTQENSRLFRALEWLTTAGRMEGMSPASMGLYASYSGGTPPQLTVTSPQVKATWTVNQGQVVVIYDGNMQPVEHGVVGANAASQPDGSGTITLQAPLTMPVNGQVFILLPDISLPQAGKVNINTVWDQETLLALADSQQPMNTFGPADVTNAFTLLNQRRTQQQGNVTLGQPVQSLATFIAGAGDTQYPTGMGINNTLLPLFQPTQQNLHPYQKWEMLTKVYNNLTTRSNVFAVWVTVGFFQVTDDTARPVKLGAELGRADGRHVRHRMFAIVDRTALSGYNGPLQQAFDPRKSRGLVPHYSIID